MTPSRSRLDGCCKVTRMMGQTKRVIGCAPEEGILRWVWVSWLGSAWLVLCCVVLRCVALDFIVLYLVVLHCTCIALHCRGGVEWRKQQRVIKGRSVLPDGGLVHHCGAVGIIEGHSGRKVTRAGGGRRRAGGGERGQGGRSDKSGKSNKSD